MVGEPVASEPTQPILVVWYHALDRYNQDTGIDLHNALPGQQDLNTKAMISSFLNLRPSQKPLVPALEPILDDIDWLLSMANNGEVKRIDTTTLEHASIIDLFERVPRAEGSLREKNPAFASREIFFDILASIVIMMGLGRKSLVASRCRKPPSWPVIAQDASVSILIPKLRWQLGEVSWELGGLTARLSLSWQHALRYYVALIGRSPSGAQSLRIETPDEFMTKFNEHWNSVQTYSIERTHLSNTLNRIASMFIGLPEDVIFTDANKASLLGALLLLAMETKGDRGVNRFLVDVFRHVQLVLSLLSVYLNDSKTQPDPIRIRMPLQELIDELWYLLDRYAAILLPLKDLRRDNEDVANCLWRGDTRRLLRASLLVPQLSREWNRNIIVSRGRLPSISVFGEQHAEPEHITREDSERLRFFHECPGETQSTTSAKLHRARATSQVVDNMPNEIQKTAMKVLDSLCNRTGLLPQSSHIPHHSIKRLGEWPVAHGGFADIWLGQLHGQDVALKMIRLFANDDVEKIFTREFLHWKRLRHPNILPLIGMSDIGRISQANILIDDQGHALLADFGLAALMRDFTSTQTTSTTQHHHGKGTTRWMAPELLNPELFGTLSRHTEKSDIYAFGMVMLEVDLRVVVDEEISRILWSPPSISLSPRAPSPDGPLHGVFHELYRDHLTRVESEDTLDDKPCPDTFHDLPDEARKSKHLHLLELALGSFVTDGRQATIVSLPESARMWSRKARRS
ncbi:hypothetical protein POSPLADRAFT_1046501 [Postia placenta MAD-698-R-SB12]|uniref:Protein kinase domain-containing protein n=1 Tax=Postia placenta MAD-698-R-SB12 TaxID=670580 RepID=A0A1X6N096_9APHY|nr:hypothetical protein POSPLADRAFT_1046501 [Postia placenta MAD-698-R-SB12]OSX62034.1 hypothetical protein POSPLADRAFT_1046501 [Postia placenta MAD-698-R-SB12]